MNLNDQKNELLDAVKRPERKRRGPTNFALWAAMIFANVIFALLDVISGVTVWWMTQFILYGVLTFLAGFVPFVLHEMLFARAFATTTQKRIAVVGAVISLLSIVGIGLAAGFVNVVGVVFNALALEIGIITALILIAALHAILALAYWYVDEGIVMNQKTEQAIADAAMQGKLINAGANILEITQRRVMQRRKIGAQYDPAALTEILKQLGIDPTDADGDGIPDVLQGRGGGQGQPRQMNQFAANTQQPHLRQDDRGPADPKE